MNYDYVIIGGGSAGCVLANRLSADPVVRVLLLEAGPPPDSFWIGMPAGLPMLLGRSPYNWPDTTAPAAGLGGRSLRLLHGRTLGGSSAINAMVYMRGHPEDYDGWRQSGAVGWAWDDVLPYFRRSEDRLGAATALHGVGGELAVSDPTFHHPSVAAFVATGVAMGLPDNPDFNGLEQDGAGLVQLTIRGGRRCSAADAFLKPVRARKNLTILTDSTVQRIEITQGRACAVHLRRERANQRVIARREIILSAGAIDSPRLLMLSGIGPGALLQAQSIAVQADLPGVGGNLHDHPIIGVTADTQASASLNKRIIGAAKLYHGLRYLLTHSGAGTLGGTQAGAFLRCLPGANRPDVQLSFRPFSTVGRNGRTVIDKVPRVAASATFLRPRSRGAVRLASADPDDRPLIDPAYLSDPVDERGLMEGVRFLARMFRTSPMAELVTSVALPGDPSQKDDALSAYVRAGAASMCHQVGTCRMGNDPLAVVDAHLKVRGISGLRVVDASIMPTIPAGNTNAPTIMIAEKGSDMILCGA